MERKHKNLRDVGLALQRLRCGGVGSTSLSENVKGASSRTQEPLLRCGRLLRCGAIDSCSFNELRRPKTIVNLRMGEECSITQSLVSNGVKLVHVPAENSLEKYETSDSQVQAWLQEVVGLFAQADTAFPVLIHCRSGKDRTGVVVAALLSLLGVPEPLVVREFLLSEGAQESNLKKSLAGFRKSGGIDAYLSKAGSVDIAAVRANLVGHTSAEERASEELKWLQQEVPLMCGLAREAAQGHDEEEASYWSGQVVDASAELASRLPCGDAAAALYCQGWALGQLQRREDACEVLSLGKALAQRGQAKSQVLKKLEKELASHGEELCVMDSGEAADAPGDPHVGLMLLDVENSDKHWQASLCPEAFSWIRCGELAVSATPKAEHLPALERLRLKQRVMAEPLGKPKPPEEHVNDVVSQVAASLASGTGCLLHCRDGFASSSMVAACFLILYGLDLTPKASGPGQPQMTAGEAVELLRTWRQGALAEPEEEERVQQFAQAAWAKHVENTQRAFGGSSSALAPREKKTAPPSAKVVKQPGDGNCLFHSLAYALGGTAASLRKDICEFMEKNPSLEIAGTSLADWIQMLAGAQVAQYARKMAKGSQWGGAPEIASCAHMAKVNIHVYERRSAGFELTVPFDVGSARTVTVLYVGGVHYDALTF